MTRELVTITIGDRSFDLDPLLNIGQLEKIEAVLQEKGARPAPTAIAIIKIGFARRYGDVVVEDLEGSMAEMTAAMKTIIEIGWPPEEQPKEAA